jgi:hypothetical protein
VICFKKLSLKIASIIYKFIIFGVGMGSGERERKGRKKGRKEGRKERRKEGRKDGRIPCENLKAEVDIMYCNVAAFENMAILNFCSSLFSL